MEFERKRHKHTYMNIASLVDVVFLLLLFFMLTSHLVQEPVIKINLPKSKTAEAQKDTIKTIYISKDGSIYFMDKMMDLSRLQIAIKKALNGGQMDFLRIKADRESDVGILVNVIDEVRLSGIRHYSIMTQRK